MDNLKKGSADIIKDKYVDSPVQELYFNLINLTLNIIDAEINKKDMD